MLARGCFTFLCAGGWLSGCRKFEEKLAKLITKERPRFTITIPGPDGQPERVFPYLQPSRGEENMVIAMYSQLSQLVNLEDRPELRPYWPHILTCSGAEVRQSISAQLPLQLQRLSLGSSI